MDRRAARRQRGSKSQESSGPTTPAFARVRFGDAVSSPCLGASEPQLQGLRIIKAISDLLFQGN